MCTVTFIPKGKLGYMLTSSRDEKITRPLAEPPRRYCIDNQVVIFPKDPQGNGSWIAMEGKNISLCLLNGAFATHIPRPPYRRSRGLVLLDFLKYGTATHFVSAYNFIGIEPFTLLVLQSIHQRTLMEIRWDGASIHLIPKDAQQPHIWSSATLYSPEIRLKREQWYADFLASHHEYTTEHMLDFHRFAGEGDLVNGLCINRDNGLQTVSITSIRVNDVGEHVMTYQDLVRETLQAYRIF